MSLKGTNNITEEELIRKCTEGDEACCRMLFEKYYGTMLNVCRRYAKDMEEAEDMLQEGFIRLFKNLKQFDGLGSFEGWVRRVMVTTSINYFRKFHLNDKVQYLENEKLAVLEAVHTASSDNYTGGSSDSEMLLTMIRQLPPAYKVVFNLHAIEGYSHAEIAGMLNITESTSRSNLAKARQNLQFKLQTSYLQYSKNE